MANVNDSTRQSDPFGFVVCLDSLDLGKDFANADIIASSSVRFGKAIHGDWHDWK